MPLLCPTDSGMLYFHFHWILGIFLNFSLMTSVTHWFFSSVLFSFHLFEYFLGNLLLFRFSFMLLWYDMMQVVILIFLKLLKLALCPTIWSILKKVPWAGKKNGYWQLLGEILYRCQPCLFGLMLGLALKFLCWSLSGWSIYWWHRDIQVSHFYCASVYLCSLCS
jgi:hypothetical protein